MLCLYFTVEVWHYVAMTLLLAIALVLVTGVGSYFIRQLWTALKDAKSTVAALSAQAEAGQRAQYGVNDGLRTAIQVLHGEMVERHKTITILIGSANSELSTDGILIENLGNRVMELEESRKQDGIDTAMRFENIEKSLKIKTVETGYQNQSRSKTWAEVKTDAAAGAARERQHTMNVPS